MLVTGLFLWWPRDARGLGGAMYPRLRSGKRVFWRDLHAVTGLWISALALFLLITALPWTYVAGNALLKVRIWAAPAPTDWNIGGGDPHAAHRQQAAAAAVATPLTVDQVIARIEPYGLEPPVRLYLPNQNQREWKRALGNAEPAEGARAVAGPDDRRADSRRPVRRQVGIGQGHSHRHSRARGPAVRPAESAAGLVHRAAASSRCASRPS